MAQKFTTGITVRDLASAASDAVAVSVSGDSNDRIKFEAGGKLVWGSGASAGDVNLYRDAADRLKTDDAFQSDGGIITVTTAGTPTLSLPDGALAIDTTNNLLYIRTGGAWEIASGGGASVTTSDAAPSAPEDGDLWYETDTGSMFVYYDDGASQQWVEVGTAGVIAMSTQSTAPTTPSNGDLWFDTDTARTYVYYDDGSSAQWVEVGAASAAASGQDGYIQFATGGSFNSASALVWDNANERVGIGTASPASSLEVQTDFPKITLTNDDQLVSADAYFAGIEMRDSSENLAGAVGFISGEDQDMRITSYRAGADLHLVTGGANNTRVTVTDTGNVGIGTTSPAVDLHVFSSSSGVTTQNPSAKIVIEDSASAGIGINSSNTGWGYVRFVDPDNSAVGGMSYSHSADELKLRAAGSDRLTINSSGSVGINDTTPSYTLDVNGDINATGNIRSNGVSITSNHGWHTRMLSADALTLTSSLQWVPFGYDDIDTDSYHDTTTNKTRITIPSNLGGWYAISMRVAITYVNPPSLLTLFCRPNGNGNSTTGTLIGTIVPQATFGGGGSVSGTIYLPGGTYIEMGVYATGGSSVSLLGTSTGQYTTVFHGVRVSP